MNYNVINLEVFNRPNVIVIAKNRISDLQYGDAYFHSRGSRTERLFNLYMSNRRIDLRQNRLASVFHSFERHLELHNLRGT